MTLFQKAQESFIAEEAAKLFFATSINEVTFKSLAAHLGIGEATLYRRYGTKVNLVLSVASYLQGQVFDQFFPKDTNLSGYQIVEHFYYSFLNIFRNTPAYYKFINEFDALMVNTTEEMHLYEEGISSFKASFDEAYKKGVEDDSIQVIDNIDDFYFATTHALMGLCKKLAYQNVISQDFKIDKVGEIKVLIETILYRLKKQ